MYVAVAEVERVYNLTSTEAQIGAFLRTITAHHLLGLETRTDTAGRLDPPRHGGRTHRVPARIRPRARRRAAPPPPRCAVRRRPAHGGRTRRAPPHAGGAWRTRTARESAAAPWMRAGTGRRGRGAA